MVFLALIIHLYKAIGWPIYPLIFVLLAFIVSLICLGLFVTSFAKSPSSRYVKIAQCWQKEDKTAKNSKIAFCFASTLFGSCLLTDYRIWKPYSPIFNAGQGVSLFCYHSSATSARRKWSVYDTGRLSNQYVTTIYVNLYLPFSFDNFFLCCNMWWWTILSLFTLRWCI